MGRRARNEAARVEPEERTETAAEWVAVDRLAPWDRNPRINDAAAPEVALSIVRFGWGNPILARREDAMVIAGHTRLKAARLLPRMWADADEQEREGWSLDAVRLATHPTPRVLVRWMDLVPAEARALALADNRLGELAEWDADALRGVLDDLAMETSLEGLGWSKDDLKALREDFESDEDGSYTSKVKAPVYTPKGERPAVSDLFDRTKTRALLDEVERVAPSLPRGLADFLRHAAERHTGFNFRAIAEYYCHATPEVQQLMESSGLVIIDYGRAVEEGFVKVTNRLGALADQEEALRDGADEVDDA